MKNTYSISIIDYNKQKTNSYGYPYNISNTIFRNGFDKVVEFLGGYPRRQSNGWSAMKGDTEYIITKL